MRRFVPRPARMFPQIKVQSRRALRTFLTGALAILPLAATLTLLAWFWQLLAAWLGPSSVFGSLLVAIGFSVSRSESVGYLLGLLVEAGLQRGIQRLVDRVVQRIPLVRNIYDLVRRMVELFSRRNGDGLNSMSPVWLHFGGRPADAQEAGKVAVLALLCTPEPIVMEGGRSYLGVLIPTAPVPVGGGLLYVPQEWVSPADIGVEGLTSIYVSMGLTTGQYIQQPPAAAAPPASSGAA